MRDFNETKTLKIYPNIQLSPLKFLLMFEMLQITETPEMLILKF